MYSFYSHGKLLLTGEYLVLNGAKSLALPVKFGQKLKVSKIFNPELVWESYTDTGKKWFSCTFSLNDLSFSKESDTETAQKLKEILIKSRELNDLFLRSDHGFHVETFLEFPVEWGLGTSSTLINNIAQWAEVNPYSLLYQSFGGSGYDIACARNNSPILFKINGDKPLIEKAAFDPVFKDQLYFIYLNKKQNSGNEIGRYRAQKTDNSLAIKETNRLTDNMISCKDLKDFERILAEHENIIASVIGREPVQKVLFPDYFGQIKSLGAWGGDFILATGNEHTPEYFKKKGFKTVIPFNEMVL